MFSIHKIELNVIQMYIQHVRETFPADHSLANHYVSILKICEWQRKRKLTKKKQTLDDLQVLKHGHRTAEHFLLEVDVPGAKPQSILREIKNILNLIALEFHAEIVAIESRHPEMKAEFAREREAHRIRWNDYLEATQQKDQS